MEDGSGTKRRVGVNALVLGLIALCAVGGVVVFRYYTEPLDTPGNATIDFFVDGTLGEGGGAWDRLCSRLQDSAFAHDGEDFDEVISLVRSKGGVSASDRVPTKIDGDRAVVVIDVRPFGVPNDRENVEWSVSLVRERGGWRVCGVDQRG